MKNKIAWVVIWTLIASVIVPFGFAQPSDVVVPEFRSAVLDIGNIEELNAYPNGVELSARVTYDDIENTPFRKNIVRMAALGLAKRQGDTSFHPETEMTGFESVKYLVRLVGGEQNVEQAVLPQTGGLSDDSIIALYNEQYAAEALAQGILLPDEYTEMDQPKNREQIAVWVARALNLDPVIVDLESVFGFYDYNEVTPTNRGLIEALLRAEIMNSGNDGRFNPTSTMSRGEFMEVLDAAYAQIYAQDNIEVKFGLVTGVQKDTDQEVGYTIDNRKLIIRNVDGTATSIKSSVNNKTNQKQDFVLYKDKFVTDASGVLVGDEIRYFTKDGQVIYVEVLDDNTVLEKMRLTEEQDGTLTTYFGSIYEILTQKTWKDDRYIESKRYRVRTYDGQTIDLVVETDLYTGVTNDMITYKNNKIGGMDMLEEGDDISFVVKNYDDVVYVSAKELWKDAVSGTVRYVKTDETGAKTVTIFGYDDVIYEYPVASYASVTINSSYGNLGDLKYGQDVTLTLNQGYITAVDSETFTGEPGYIPKYGKSRTATIYDIYPSGIAFDLGEEVKSFEVSEDTPIIKSGVAITKNALRAGDKVKLYFDDIYSDKVSKMEVEGIERLIQHLYKGSLASVNETKRTLTLYAPRYLKSDTWESLDDYTLELDVADDVQINQGNQVVDFDEFEKVYTDKTVYVVVEESYGDPVVSKVAIKTGGENIFEDSVRDVDRTLSSMELDNRMNFNITDATIVVKESRIIDSSLLSKNDNVVVVSEMSLGENNANVIKMVTGMESIFDRIYIGAIETVEGNYFTLRNWTQLEDNEWNDVDDSASGKYYYYSNSDIMDVTDSDKPKAVTAANFFNKSYSRLENKYKGDSKDNKGLEYKRYYAIIVTNENTKTYESVVAMNIRHKELVDGWKMDDKLTDVDDVAEEIEDILDKMVLTRGIVEAIDTDWKRIQLTDTNKWSSASAEWKTVSTDTYVEYENSIIVSENNNLEIDDLETGDYVYILRYEEKAQVIFVSEE